MYRYLVMFLFILSCSNESETNTKCVVNDDCDSGQICGVEGCISISEKSCYDQNKCPSGYECLKENCSKIPGTRDDMGSGTDSGNRNNGRDMEQGDGSSDLIPPKVISFSPADGTSEVAVDTVIKIELSEVPHTPTINSNTVVLLDSADQKVECELNFTAGTRKIELKPKVNLQPSSGYRILLTEFVRDLAFNQLKPTSSSFITIFKEDVKLRMLAEKYAPTIYQSLGSTAAGLRNIDIPTTFDFDGNSKAADNRESAEKTTTDPVASIYYNVISTETTYFISYFLYYPIFQKGGQKHEHSNSGYVAVIDKKTKKLLFAEGLSIKISGTDSVIAYKPEGSTVKVINEPPFIKSYPVANQDKDHYPLFITPGTHEPCNFFQKGPQLPIACRHRAGKFMNEDPSKGLVMKLGSGQKYSEATTHGDGYKEMSYKLVSFVKEVWAKRGLIGPNSLFSARRTYKPSGAMRPGSTEVGPTILVPASLSSKDDDSYGKLPFRWLPAPSIQNAGQWFLDPAYILSARYKRLPQPFSLDYCLHPFFGIDRNGDAKCQ